MKERIRNLYGVFLHYWRRIFFYPRYELPFTFEADYDAYWLQRRGKRLGSLNSWQRGRADLAARYMRKEGNIEVADIGAGDGSILQYLRDIVPGIVRTVGYDSSQLALAALQNNGSHAELLDLSNPAWKSALLSCDYALLFEILEHVPNSEEVLKAALDSARQGVFVSLPNSGFIAYRLRLLIGMFPMQWVRYPNEHLRFWTLRDMRWWLRALGLSSRATIVGYRGVPLLNKLYPALFAAGLFIWIQKD